MLLEKGSESNPTGNLILYCFVNGENPFQPGCKIIASNVVVSYLKINENYPVVTFPPVSYKTLEDLKQIILESGEIHDVARLPDFEMPPGKEPGNRYIQERMEQYNGFVMKYVELCKNQKREAGTDIQGESIPSYIDALTKLSLQYRSAKGLAREAAKMKVEKLITQFSGSYPQFDLDNYKNAIMYPGQKGDELASLYIQKFNAISNENYETASVLKKQIEAIESY
ncbi:MAG: UvrB/UvrC motif-containing protein [Spirochaetota bacterium]